MLELSRRPSVIITLLVALTTVCALALPEGLGGRDSVVRLTRGGPQRLGCADAFCNDHDAPEAFVVAAQKPQLEGGHVDGPPAVLAAPYAVLAPADGRADSSWTAPQAPVLAPPGHAVSGRAPPAR